MTCAQYTVLFVCLFGVIYLELSRRNLRLMLLSYVHDHRTKIWTSISIARTPCVYWLFLSIHFRQMTTTKKSIIFHFFIQTEQRDRKCLAHITMIASTNNGNVFEARKRKVSNDANQPQQWQNEDYYNGKDQNKFSLTVFMMHCELNLLLHTFVRKKKKIDRPWLCVCQSDEYVQSLQFDASTT